MLDVTTRGIVEPVILNIIRKPIGVGGMGVVGNLGDGKATRYEWRFTDAQTDIHTYIHRSS